MANTIVPGLRSRNKLYLSGPFGAGKTTLAVERLRYLLEQERIRGDDILVLVPQRSLGQPYAAAIRRPDIPPGSPVAVTTIASMARQAVELYWPLLATAAGFAEPDREPVFLDLETSQYHMGPFVDHALDQAEFAGIRVERSRVISQILDNLNKSALNGFSIDEAYARLELSVPPGDSRTARLNALRAACRISHEFRNLCLTSSLVDFSLQIELLTRHVLANEWSRTHFFRSRRHLIFDNAEEDTYAAQTLIAQWLPYLESALILSDDDGGVRVFLGAAPSGVSRLAELCDEAVHLDQSWVMPPHIRRLERLVDQLLPAARRASAHTPQPAPPDAASADDEAASKIRLPVAGFRFYPQMLAWVTEQIRSLVLDQGVAPGAIAILAPYVSDALRFSLQTELDKYGILSTTHRPSRALHAEPAARSLTTLAALAHPLWGIAQSPTDVALALSVVVDGLDPVRANLLAQHAYSSRGAAELQSFEGLQSAIQQRITYRLGEAYERLFNWLADYRAGDEIQPLDQFWARLFSELLSQPGFGFHHDLDAARVAHQLVTSARNFRWALESSGQGSERTSQMGREYVHLLTSGAVGALYSPGWREAGDAVLIAPAYTFLMRNRAVDYQFWLDIGSSGWWERLYQPLTHPHVMSHNWPPNQPWTDFDEFTTRQANMRRLTLGLLRRTRRQVFLALSNFSESGYEQRGPLLSLINRILAVDAAHPPENIEEPGLMGIAPGPSLDASEEGFFGV